MNKGLAPIVDTTKRERLVMETILLFLYRVPAMVVAVTLHEYVKAAASWRLGDNNPKLDKRITLNPLRHIDLVGALCIIFFTFGWGKPVSTSPMFYANRRKATWIVYGLPSVVNLVVGFIFGISAFLIGFAPMPEMVLNVVVGVVYQLAVVNMAMFLFNIIPIYPLSGAKIFSLYLNAEARVRMARYERWFQLFLVMFIILGFAEMMFMPIITATLDFTVVGL